MRLSLIVLALTPTAALAQDGMVAARVLPGWTTDRGTLMAAVAFDLSPGWKTYWRAPGEAGIPPLFDWSASENLGQVALHWPTPQVFMTSGMRSIGYHDQLILPVEITPAVAGAPVTLTATIDMGICRDICVPVQLTVSAPVPQPGAMDGAIAAALADRPRVADGVGARCDLVPGPDSLSIVATLGLPSLGGDEVAVIEPNAPGLWVGDAWSDRQGDTLVAEAEVLTEGDAAPAIQRSDIRITVIGASGAVELTGCSGG
jgi:DsbC/DsbD-like thiol-disulfide interchange protein